MNLRLNIIEVNTNAITATHHTLNLPISKCQPSSKKITS